MSKPVLYYFVDTNLFLQCRPLHQLDWVPWKSFDEVRLIVAKPVLREIDYRKNKGNDRTSRRARATSAMFRGFLSTGTTLVRSSDPRVVLSIELAHDYSKKLRDKLDYAERDDQLIGTVYRFAQRNQDADVRLLTHDTTPLFVARGLHLKADVIQDSWLLPAETTKTEKKVKSLQAEIARLRDSEPSFAIHFLDQTGKEVDRYDASYTWFERLSDGQVAELMQCLKDHFPLETDFGGREPEVRRTPPAITNLFMGITREYIPATDEAIADYRDVQYPRWLNSCEERLRHHHWLLQRDGPELGFTFVATNRGTRPAVDALITIAAQGDLLVKPPSADAEDLPDGAHPDVTLPEPPTPPRGRWRNATTVALENIATIGASIPQLRGMGQNLPDIGTFTASRGRRDPNSFYYKPACPSEPEDAFSLECEQWRHDDGDEHFVGEIHIPKNRERVAGALKCRIQASNLSTSESKTIPIRITTTNVSSFESARKMVDALLRKLAEAG